MKIFDYTNIGFFHFNILLIFHMHNFRSYIDTNHSIHTRNLLFAGRAKRREGSLQSGSGHGLPDGTLVLDISWVYVSSPKLTYKQNLTHVLEVTFAPGAGLPRHCEMY